MSWKLLWKKLLFPPGWLTAILVPVSTAGLVFVFMNDLTQTPAAYGIYITAFYTLCVLSAGCAVVLPEKHKIIRAKIDAHPLGHRLRTDPAFKTNISLYTLLGANLVYTGLHVLAWFIYRSMWFMILAVYYGILAVMRFLLVRYVRIHGLGKNRLGELKRAGLCSGILLLLNVVLTGAVLMILYRDKGFEYGGILIYAMAAYTFFITAHAAAGLFKYRKYGSPVMTVSKIIVLSAALVSMLALETAMLSRFGGDMAPEHRQLMIALTGAGVSVAVITMSAGMIAAAAKESKEIEKNGREKRNF